MRRKRAIPGEPRPGGMCGPGLLFDAATLEMWSTRRCATSYGVRRWFAAQAAAQPSHHAPAVDQAAHAADLATGEAEDPELEAEWEKS